MQKYLITLLISGFIAINCSLISASEKPPFNYSQSVALILKVENGGHIFQRPDEDEPRNTFRMSFRIISKYLGEVQADAATHTLDMSSLVSEYSFVLINYNDTKLFHMGDHWIGDENSFAVMTSEDYFSLKEIFDSSKRHRNDTTPENVLKGYTADIHNLWNDDPEEYERLYHFPEKAAKLNNEINPFEEPASHIPPTTENISTEATSEQSAQEETINTQRKSLKTTPVNSQSNIVADSVQNTKIPSRDNSLSGNQTTSETLENAENQSYPPSLLLFALTLFVVGYFWRRQR
jgi:hypothetical protein